jgi:hypothetical protein
LIKNKINSVKDNDTFLRSHSLGYFQHLPQFPIGKQLTITEEPACLGNISPRLDNTAQAWIFDGQLLLTEQQAATDVVIMQDGIIKGLGILIGADDSLLPTTQQDVQQSRFRAYAPQQALNPSQPITLLGIYNNTTQCQMTLPSITPSA